MYITQLFTIKICAFPITRMFLLVNPYLVHHPTNHTRKLIKTFMVFCPSHIAFIKSPPYAFAQIIFILKRAKTHFPSLSLRLIWPQVILIRIYC